VNSYQKLAIFLLRLIGGSWAAFFGLAWLLYAIEFISGITVEHYPLHTIIGNMGYLAIGLLAVSASKPLGLWVGRGLD